LPRQPRRNAALPRTAGGRARRILVISFWESLESIKEFAGVEIEIAHYYPEDNKFLLELEPKVSHYEILSDSEK
jgi:heme-degrading monooxygenase HmoA